MKIALEILKENLERKTTVFYRRINDS